MTGLTRAAIPAPASQGRAGQVAAEKSRRNYQLQVVLRDLLG